MQRVKLSSVIQSPDQFIKTAQINKQSPAYIKLMAAIQNTPENKRNTNSLALMLDGNVFYLTLNQLAFHLQNETPLGYVIIRDANKLEQEIALRRSTQNPE